MTISQELPHNCSPIHVSDVLHTDVYKELRALAIRHMIRQHRNQTLQATVLVHEMWLRLAKQERKWRDRHHFFATASLTMRHILIDYARQKKRERHGGHLKRMTQAALEDLAATNQDDMILMIDEGITELEKVHPERARVVVDRFFGGLTNHEIAEQLGIGERSVERHWALAKVWLFRWIQQSNSPQNKISRPEY